LIKLVVIAFVDQMGYVKIHFQVGKGAHVLIIIILVSFVNKIKIF
jgi:hypothetical protein